MFRITIRHLGFLLGLLAATAAAQEKEIITIDGAKIRGDQEMPTVMYLVAWQPPEIQALEQPTERLMLERAFTPLDREQFRRMLDYHRRFTALSLDTRPADDDLTDSE